MIWKEGWPQPGEKEKGKGGVEVKGGHGDGDGDGWCDTHECELTEEMPQRTEKKTRGVSHGVMVVAAR